MSLTIQIIGYIASLLVFATFYVKRIMTLRVIAVVSNVAFISYAIGADLVPIVVLHGFLLPLNLYRIYELKRNIASFTDTNKMDVQILKGYGKKKFYKKDEIIFDQGVESQAIYFLESGLVKEYSDLTDHWNSKEIKSGDAFGLLSYFSKDHRTFFRAQAQEDSVVYVIDHERLSELCIQSPKFGFLLMNWLASRLESDLLYVQKQA